MAIQPNGDYVISAEQLYATSAGYWLVPKSAYHILSSFLGSKLFPEAQKNRIVVGCGVISARYCTVYENDPIVLPILAKMHIKVVHYDPNDECILCGLGRMCSGSLKEITEGFRAPIKAAALFLAATAINSEDDYMQWFMDEEHNKVFLCESDKVLLKRVHKLDPVEIAEYFQEKI